MQLEVDRSYPDPRQKLVDAPDDSLCTESATDERETLDDDVGMRREVLVAQPSEPLRYLLVSRIAAIEECEDGAGVDEDCHQSSISAK